MGARRSKWPNVRGAHRNARVVPGAWDDPCSSGGRRGWSRDSSLSVTSMGHSPHVSSRSSRRSYTGRRSGIHIRSRVRSCSRQGSAVRVRTGAWSLLKDRCTRVFIRTCRPLGWRHSRGTNSSPSREVPDSRDCQSPWPNMDTVLTTETPLGTVPIMSRRDAGERHDGHMRPYPHRVPWLVMRARPNCCQRGVPQRR